MIAVVLLHFCIISVRKFRITLSELFFVFLAYFCFLTVNLIGKLKNDLRAVVWLL